MPKRTWQTGVKAGAAADVAGSSAGTLSWAAYSNLRSQATAARGVIGRNVAKPPEADGVYSPGAAVPERWLRTVSYDVHLMIFGDSTAAGVGCLSADEVPGNGGIFNETRFEFPLRIQCLDLIGNFYGTRGIHRRE